MECEKNEFRLNSLFRFEEEGEDGKGKLIGKLCRKGELYYEDKLKAAGLS